MDHDAAPVRTPARAAHDKIFVCFVVGRDGMLFHRTDSRAGGGFPSVRGQIFNSVVDGCNSK